MKGKESCRSWILTLSAELYSEDDVAAGLAAYVYAGQLEEGAGGFRHWQIYVENPTPVRFSTLRNRFPSGHFEPRRGTRAEALAYVTKADTFAGISLKNGEIDVREEPGRRNDLERLRGLVLYQGLSAAEVLLAEPGAWRFSRYLRELEEAAEAAPYLPALKKYRYEKRPLNVRYIWGETGVGKTHFVYEKHGYRDIYRVTTWEHPFDGYRGQSVLVLDEFRGQINPSLLLTLLDDSPNVLPARYENRQAAYTTAYVLSNLPLSEQYRDVQRKEPETWRALLRRFDSVECMASRGVLVKESEKSEAVA